MRIALRSSARPPSSSPRLHHVRLALICGSAHHWGRVLQAQGHRVVLLPPHTVRPYIARNKTDQADAKGILEAFRNEAIHSVPVKSVAQQTLAALHRRRSRWLATRTARINTVRGVLREFGIVISVGASRVVPAVGAALEDAESRLPDALRPALAQACTEIRQLEERIRGVELQLEALARETPVVTELRTIPVSAGSPPPPSSPSWATSTDSRPAATSRASSGSPRANTRAA